MTSPATGYTIRYPSPAQVGAASALATLGALPLGNVPDEASTTAEGEDQSTIYALSAVGGAMVGGGLVGYVAAGDLRGAATGSLLTAGLASLADAVVLLRRVDKRILGIGLGVAGLGAVAGSLYLSATRK